jgi:hypothetical protein
LLTLSKPLARRFRTPKPSPRKRTLGKIEKTIGRDAQASGSTNISLTLFAARQLELYVRGKKTQISNRRMAEIYYKVLCAGVEQLPRSNH